MVLLRIDGEVGAPLALGFAELAALPEQVADVGAILPGREGGAVRLGALVAAAAASAGARWVTLASADGRFSASVPLDAVGDALVVYRLGDRPLPDDQGGPVRFFIPQAGRCTGPGTDGVDACANVKALARITLSSARGADTRHR
jgi:DMSO/TMAO reductase YedYZ molybdopterin-dependent catalytic subunit